MQVLNGFVKIHRKLLQWGWYQDNVIKSVFLHILLTASYRESEWMGRTIKRGQVITGTQKLANDLGFTREQVRRALAKLKSTNEITIETTNKYSIITVVNWEDYQVIDEETTNKTTNKITHEQPTNNQQTTNKQPHLKNKRIKEIKNLYKKEKGETDFDRLIFDFSQNEVLQQTLFDFIKMRSGIKAPLTTRALELVLKKLERLSSDEAEQIAIINQSIENSWRGVFPLKEDTTSQIKGKCSNFNNRTDVDYDAIEREALRRRINQTVEKS